MPYPTQINSERILEQAREIVESGGAGSLSMQGLARALGVKAPSLYRYFPGKTDLLRALNLQTVQQLIEGMHSAAEEDGEAGERMLVMSRTWREFARTHPEAYRLAFADPNPELRPDAGLLEGLAIPLQQMMAGVAGEKDSLAALRGLWALLHGFVLLELSGQFRRGGDLEADYNQAVEAYVSGWSK